MLDQAYDLRRLAQQRSRPAADRGVGRPTLIAVAGGKGGVGTTAVALGIAEKMAAAGTRALFVDADPRGGDAALRCGLEERYTLADLLAGRRAWAEVMEAGPSGLSLVAGARWSEDLGNGSPAAADSLLRLLRQARAHTDVAVLDVGNGLGRAVLRMCHAADAVVMVATPETAAVIRAFAALKTLVRYARQQFQTDTVAGALSLFVAVRGATSHRELTIVHYRLRRACRRLLGIDLDGPDAAGNPDAVSRGTLANLNELVRRLELEYEGATEETIKP